MHDVFCFFLLFLIFFPVCFWYWNQKNFPVTCMTSRIEKNLAGKKQWSEKVVGTKICLLQTPHCYSLHDLYKSVAVNNRTYKHWVYLRTWKFLLWLFHHSLKVYKKLLTPASEEEQMFLWSMLWSIYEIFM